MDLSPEELDVSPPCFLVENSQDEESLQLCRSDSDPHASILKRLPIFALSTTSFDPCHPSSSRSEAFGSLPRKAMPLSRPTGSGENGRQGESGSSRGQHRNGDQERRGGGSGGRGHGDDSNQGAGGGDGDDDADNDGDENDEESPPAEEPPSSSNSDTIPSLIRPESIVGSSQWKGQKFSAAEMKLQQAPERRAHHDSLSSGFIFEHGSGGSVRESSGDHLSQASTGIVGEGDDVAADLPLASGTGSLSEELTAPVVSPLLKGEKKSTSSSGEGKSVIGSAGSSSNYHGDLSSLSSGGSVQLSPEVRKHLPLPSMLRAQSTSDTSSSSAASKEDKIHSTVGGYTVFSVKGGDESQFCSSQEDMFGDNIKEPGHVSSDLSSEPSGSGIVYHSTPTENHTTKAVHGQPLHQQVLSTTKQRTSTPLGGDGFLPTPPSQGTPINSVSRFQSLQFSGEPIVRETSSSDKVSVSSEERNSALVLVPSSPTASENESAEKETNRMGKAEQEQPTALKHKNTSDEDDIMIPRWQQLQQIAAQDSAANEKKSISSNSGSSGRAFADDADKVECQESLQLHEWQSVISAVRETTSSSSEATKVETAEQMQMLATSDKDRPQQGQLLVEESLSQGNIAVPLVSKVHLTKEAAQQDQSLSPSSLAFNPFNTDESSSKCIEEGPVTAPEMSEDVFHPSITQESVQQVHNISDAVVNQPAELMGEEDDNKAEDSQGIVFSLHLTQSQADMDSQVPLETSLHVEEIREVTTVPEVLKDVQEETTAKTTPREQEVSLTEQGSNSKEKYAEITHREDLPSLTKQDSSSQSILAPLHLTELTGALDKGVAQERPFEKVLSQEVLNVSSNVIGIRESESATVVPPEQPIVLENSGDGSSAIKEGVCEDQEGLPWKPTKPRHIATIFSETSSESGQSAAFHFSLPKQPLRPLTSTTPPPVRPASDTPTSPQMGSRRSILPVVSETPGMSSQAPPGSVDQPRPQSLSISMPRLGSPLSDSENTEPVFRFDTALPLVTTRPGTSASGDQLSAPEQPRSLSKSKKREVDVDSEDDPFAFTAEDEDREPLRKRPRRKSPIRARETSFVPDRVVGGIDESPESSAENAEEGPSFTGEQSVYHGKEQHASTKFSLQQENVSSKRIRFEESSDSGQSEVAEERRSKRGRRGEDEGEPEEKTGTVHYRQITHTRTVTTLTTHVQRVITVCIVDKDSGEVVQVLTYEEDDQPETESVEKEKEEVNDFVESSGLDGSRLTVKRQVQQQQRRSSPRIKRPSSGKTPGKKKSGKGVNETVRKSGASEGLSQIGYQPIATPPAEEEPTDLQRTSSSDSTLTPGTRVLAKWLDGYFYPGVITTRQYKNGRYLVTFDDGDKRRIPRENIIIKDLLPAGQSVMAQGEFEDDFYEQGVIVGHYRDGSEQGYEIQMQNGAIRRFPRSRVILSEQQAAAILSSESSFNTTSGSSVSIGAHSLRLRKDTSTGSSSTSPQILTKPGGTGAKDTSKDTTSKDWSGSSSDEKKRGKKAARSLGHASPKAMKAKTSKTTDQTPKSTRKSTHKTKAQVRRESESSSDEQRGALPSKRSSPRKQFTANVNDSAEETAIGGIPANRNLFAGLAFLVTGVERDRNEPDESDSESERIEFNRDSIKRQIEAGGGVVLSSFPQSQISGAECFLISNRHQRTQKYFQSLASGIPCVSHMWINDSCSFDKRLDYKRYLLPAGESLEAERIVECRPRKNILGNLRVYLHGSENFKRTWGSVSLAAGSKMVSKIPNRLDYQCDVIICEDHRISASVIHSANMLAIPIVSLEWLLQSLINGRQMPFDSHPKYRPGNA